LRQLAEYFAHILTVQRIDTQHGPIQVQGRAPVRYVYRLSLFPALMTNPSFLIMPLVACFV